MTIGEQSNNFDAFHGWSARVLGVAAEADGEAVRLAMLEHLAKVDFLPSAAWDLARRMHAQRSEGLGNTRALLGLADADVETELRTRMEAFASDFFTLEPGERRGRWLLLERASTTFPRLKARLLALRPGLDVPTALPKVNTLATAPLIQQLRSVAICRPARGAAVRAAALAGWRNDLPTAMAAVAEVRRHHRELANFQPALLDGIVTAGNSGPKVERAKKRPPPTTRASEASSQEGDELLLDGHRDRRSRHWRLSGREQRSGADKPL